MLCQAKLCDAMPSEVMQYENVMRDDVKTSYAIRYEDML